jgi:hypothetical protein
VLLTLRPNHSVLKTVSGNWLWTAPFVPPGIEPHHRWIARQP